MNRSFIILLLIGFTTIFSACRKNDDPASDDNFGKIVINFEHFADGKALVFDEMRYTNAAGNPYEVTEIQWFVSDITLHKKEGGDVLIDQEDFAHYIDTNIPKTSTWIISDKIPDGEYSSISMTFGIKGEKNKPYMYTDPPESDMLWPSNLGGDQGGYHYMKLNGFWKNTNDQREPFNFHLGVGQERDADNKVTGFIQNWIETELPGSSFRISEKETIAVTIRMNVEKWWGNPNIYDHNVVGGKIMQNQDAMRMGVENGKSVFTIGQISTIVAE